ERIMMRILHAISISRIVCSISKPRWFDNNWMSGSWRRWRHSLTVSEERGGRRKTIATSSRRWWRRTGVPWRDLPEGFGPWQTVFNRFDRWSKSGKWARMFAALQSDIDDEWHSLDSTINRAHQHAAGGKGGQMRMRSVAPEADLQPRSTS